MRGQYCGLCFNKIKSTKKQQRFGAAYKKLVGNDRGFYSRYFDQPFNIAVAVGNNQLSCTQRIFLGHTNPPC